MIRPAAEAVLDLLPAAVDRDARLLDVGTGTGALAIAALDAGRTSGPPA